MPTVPAERRERLARDIFVGHGVPPTPMALNVAPWGGAARRLGTNPHAFATSVVAEDKRKVKFNRREPVTPGTLLNGAGQPSTNPVEFYADPPGSLLTAGEHKGYGLSLAIEILAGLFAFVRSAPLAAGAKEILIPGEPEGGAAQERHAHGVPRDEETWRQMARCAAEVDVTA